MVMVSDGSDGSSKFFDIAPGILLMDKLLPYMIIICTEYLFPTDFIEENDFILTKQEADDMLQKLKQTQTTKLI